MVEKDSETNRPTTSEEEDDEQKANNEKDAERNAPLQPEQPYSSFTKWQRVLSVYVASLAAFASPISSTIYYPAMLSLAHDLHTSLTNISLTITVYLVRLLLLGVLHSKTHSLRGRYSKVLPLQLWEASRIESDADQLIYSPLRYSLAQILGSLCRQTTRHCLYCAACKVLVAVVQQLYRVLRSQTLQPANNEAATLAFPR
jgi:hypothetical protein